MENDHYGDIRLLGSRWDWLWCLTLLLGLLVLPWLAPNYHLYVANCMAINVIVAVGLNVLVGYTGQISLGHAGFFAIGSYGTVVLMVQWGTPFFVALPCAAAAAAAAGCLLAIPALRLEGPYLAIATLAFGLTVTQLIGRWGFLGGHMGLKAPVLTLFGWQFSGDRPLYYVVVLIAVALTVAARNLMKTRVGRALTAIRESHVAAGAMGVDLARYKTLAFAVSAFYAGVGGGLMAFVLGYINPSAFSLILSIQFLAMVVIGGLGCVWGSVMGAVLFTFLNLKLEAVGQLPFAGPLLESFSRRWMTVGGLSNVTSIVFGLILIGIMVFEPQGLHGLWLRVKSRLHLGAPWRSSPGGA